MHPGNVSGEGDGDGRTINI